MIVSNLDIVLGQEFIGHEQNMADQSASGCDELILHFSGGSEILIYIHPEEGVKVEGD
jgi:hypothetical protein